MNNTQTQQIDHWHTQIDEVTHTFSQISSSLSLEELNLHPNPKAWSIAQIMEHLITVNATYYPVLKSLREGNYKPSLIGRFGFMANFIGKEILKSVQPNYARKIKTFTDWEPSNDSEILDIFETFEGHQEILKKQMKHSEPILDQNPIISSPINRNIVYKLSTAFDIIVAHEKRHAQQAEEIAKVIKKS